jgi:hypothetical protein
MWITTPAMGRMAADHDTSSLNRHDKPAGAGGDIQAIKSVALKGF